MAKLPSLLTIILPAVFFTFICSTHCQFFHPNIADKDYLDNIESEVQMEVEEASSVLVGEARAVEFVTRDYIGSKLKENVFKALRVLAEQEMSKMDKLGRQEAEGGESGGGSEIGGASEAESGGGGEGESGEKEETATTELTGLGTAVKINQNVFKFLGDTFKIIFKGLGGKSRKAPKEYVDEAQSLMSEPYADQLLGLVGLMANESQAVEKSEAIMQRNVGLSDVYNAMFHRGLSRSHLKFFNNNEVKDMPETESSIPILRKFNVDSFVTSFKKSVKEAKDPMMLLDLYRGVRESYKFLENMSHMEDAIKNET